MPADLRRPGDVTRYAVEGDEHDLGDGDVVIAAITSCTNTSNPTVLIAAGLVAQKAHAQGLTVKPWVKTSLAPGSQVVTDYLDKAGLQKDLDALGFNLVGYGCTTCIGNSGPLPEAISEAITENDLVACSVLSGNRNFEGRVNPDVRANYLASPPLVVAYALAGSMNIDITKEPLGQDKDGNDVYPEGHLADNAGDRRDRPQDGDPRHVREALRRRLQGRQALAGDRGVRRPDLRLGRPLDLRAEPALLRGHDAWSRRRCTDIDDARILGLFGDSITTDHISPAGSIKTNGPAGDYLVSHQVRPVDFNSYGARRGNHEVMMRGTFANIRIRNKMLAGHRGRRDQALPVRRADVDLRRGDAVPGRGRAAGRLRRQGIRHRLVARLGGQGHRAARRPRGHRRELRAHPPLQPGRHGRRALPVPRKARPGRRSASRATRSSPSRA